MLDRERPNDPRALAAYVEALLDAGKPEEARNALNR
ncbi:MAG: tetratricopeptide repeat protein [Alphaproteobacteria bacterium]